MTSEGRTCSVCREPLMQPGMGTYGPRGRWVHERTRTAKCPTDSHASVSPEQTPTPAADSAHRGEECTVGEVP